MNHIFFIDIWSENVIEDIRVPKENIKEVKDSILNKYLLKYDLIHENLQQIIDQERESMSKRVIFNHYT